MQLPIGEGRGIQAGGQTDLDYLRFVDGDSGYEARDILVEGNVMIGGSSAFSWVNIDGGIFHHNVIIRPGKWVVRILNEEDESVPMVDTQNGQFNDNRSTLLRQEPTYDFLSPQGITVNYTNNGGVVPTIAPSANLDNPGLGPVRDAMVATAKSLKLELHWVEVRRPAEFAKAFKTMADKHVGAVVVLEDGMLNANIQALAALAAPRVA